MLSYAVYSPTPENSISVDQVAAMVYIPSDFEATVVPELDDAEKELDAAIVAGSHLHAAPDGTR